MMHADSTAKMNGKFVQWFKNYLGDSEIESQDTSGDYADKDNHAYSFLYDLLPIRPGYFASLDKRFGRELYHAGDSGFFSLFAAYSCSGVFGWTVGVHVCSLLK